MKKEKKWKDLYLLVLWTAFFIYFFSVIYITLGDRKIEARRAVLEPFYSVRLIIQEKNYYYIKMLYYNVAMLIPMGILLPMISKKLRSFKIILLCGFIFSLSIETIQYFSGRGLFEVDDLIANSFGAFLGYVFFYWIHRILFNSSNKKIEKDENNS